MTSLWNLLLQRPRYTTFARLDSDGICLGFRQSAEVPAGSGWVQVSEARLGWIGHALPASARVCSGARRRWQQRSLPA